jgi:hypothetical protein
MNTERSDLRLYFRELKISISLVDVIWESTNSFSCTWKQIGDNIKIVPWELIYQNSQTCCLKSAAATSY